MPDEVVDFGLLSKKINPEIEGIREDSMIALQRDYPSREEAETKIGEHIMGLQKLRGEEHAAKYADDIKTAGEYLTESYLNNVWPNMNVFWGTYSGHLGHQYYDENGFGCFRCHDEEHVSEAGNYITMDCDLCHDEPE
jgi:hypothetical protein